MQNENIYLELFIFENKLIIIIYTQDMQTGFKKKYR